MKKWLIVLAGLMLSSSLNAAGLDDLSNRDASAGLKEALTKSAVAAVSQLGAADGFLGNDKVRIPLPDSLRKAEGLLRTLGMGKQADELSVAMNRAAESAVQEARPILVGAVKKMTVSDAKDVLSGGDDAATQYFRRTTDQDLAAKFAPIVKNATARVRLAEKYNQYAGKAAKLGLLDAKDADLDQYVTRKTLDGLFLVIGEQERAIRQDPVGQGSALLRKVFGAVAP
jgi:hypothetical protein